MLAIDVPIAAIAGLALADGGRPMLAHGDASQRRFMRLTTVVFAVFCITPIPFYFFLGWPGWETSFWWSWVDRMHNSPAIAGAVTLGVFLVTVGPAVLALEAGAWLIRKGRPALVRAGIAVFGLLTIVILYLIRDETFAVAATYAGFHAGRTFSFWSHPFFTGWLITALYFWVSLAIVYLWLRSRSSQARPPVA